MLEKYNIIASKSAASITEFVSIVNFIARVFVEAHMKQEESVNTVVLFRKLQFYRQHWSAMERDWLSYFIIFSHSSLAAFHVDA